MVLVVGDVAVGPHEAVAVDWHVDGQHWERQVATSHTMVLVSVVRVLVAVVVELDLVTPACTFHGCEMLLVAWILALEAVAGDEHLHGWEYVVILVPEGKMVVVALNMERHPSLVAAACMDQEHGML